MSSARTKNVSLLNLLIRRGRFTFTNILPAFRLTPRLRRQSDKLRRDGLRVGLYHGSVHEFRFAT